MGVSAFSWRRGQWGKSLVLGLLLGVPLAWQGGLPAWAAGGPVHRLSLGVTTDYPTLQAAVAAAQDGDVITLDAGHYREQVVITRAITLQGAGRGNTVIESPDTADLVQSGGNWKNLKAQDVFATLGIQLSSGGTVQISKLTLDGRDQGLLSDALYPNKGLYDFAGIAIFDSNTVVDDVLVTGYRYLDPTSPPPGYLPADQPAGMNINSSIFTQSKAGSTPHTLEVKNSTITKFQKTGLLAWGPTQVVNIHDNLFQGYGQTLHSSGNAIQLGSTDLTSSGGGDRRGTSGSVVNNQILGFGHVVPVNGQPGSYLNMGQIGPSGVLLYSAGSGVEIRGNTFTGPAFNNWYNSLTSNDGGFANVAISITNSANARIIGNSISGFDAAISESSAPAGSVTQVSGNTFSNNSIDFWGSSGNDQVTLGSGGETIAYGQSDNGVDTLTGLGQGDRLLVVGYVNHSVNNTTGTVAGTTMLDTESNVEILTYADARPVVDFTNGSVTAGSGTMVAAQSVQVSNAGGISQLSINTQSSPGPADLTIRLTGTYLPGNFALQGSYIRYLPMYGVSGTGNPSQGGTVQCTPTSVSSGSSATCTATANSGYALKSWSANCTSSGPNTCTLSNVTANQQVTATFNPTSVNTPVASGSVTATQVGNACPGFDQYSFAPAQGRAPNGDAYVYSQFAFTSSCNAITLRLSYPQLMPGIHRLWKFTGGQWVDWTSQATFDYDLKTVTYTVTDNGPGDNDPTVGHISDPVSLSSADPSLGGLNVVPTLSELAQLMLAGLLALLAAVAHRRKALF